MTQHTPGPWKQGTRYPNRVIGNKGDRSIVASTCLEHLDDPTPEDIANATLIAASPTLLSALRIAEVFMAGFEGDEAQEGIDGKLAQIRAAIASAEGQP